MNKDSRNQDNYGNVNSYDIKKTTYWKIYGVKRFPYRGTRKYTPLLYPSFDGGMKISNDVFGLTISQFERMYKACLERRKTKEQWILNLRYPDKSSKEYLEYIENCTDCKKDHLLCIESNTKGKYLYEHLVNIVGTEIDIRKRQRMFIIHDMVSNACLSDPTKISSGSLAEELDLPGSDRDVMYVDNCYDVVRSISNIKYPIRPTTFVMETDIDHLGFTKLRCRAAGANIYCKCHPGTCTRKFWYLSGNDFLHDYQQLNYIFKLSMHGPCLSNRENTLDIAYCLRSKCLPQNAIPWVFRRRRQWPPNFVIDRIINYGCLLVPIGPKTLPDNELFWRLSFSVAEKELVHSFNFTQLLCYGLLKLVFKRIINTKDVVKDLLCSYFLKTALFWVSEEEDIDIFQLSKIYYCFSLSLDKIISWVKTCYCPNYFIPEHNMFLGKINHRNNKILLCVLESIKSRGIDGLINNIFAPVHKDLHLSSTDNESSVIMLDSLRHKIPLNVDKVMSVNTSIIGYYKGLVIAESLLQSETSTFIIENCKYYTARICQKIVQKLQPQNTKGKTYNIRKCYHKLLQNGIKTDAVSGWLLYASYFYVTRQFNATLKLTEYVLSKWSPDMAFIGGKNELLMITNIMYILQ